MSEITQYKESQNDLFLIETCLGLPDSVMSQDTKQDLYAALLKASAGEKDNAVRIILASRENTGVVKAMLEGLINSVSSQMFSVWYYETITDLRRVYIELWFLLTLIRTMFYLAE